MSFDRTALSADRTLMSTVRTALSLIAFGLTIYEFFRKLNDQYPRGVPSLAPQRFGVAVITLGIVLLVLGIFNHLRATKERRLRRRRLYEIRLIRNPEIERPNGTLIVAILLLIVGIFSIVGVGLHIGPL